MTNKKSNSIHKPRFEQANQFKRTLAEEHQDHLESQYDAYLEDELNRNLEAQYYAEQENEFNKNLAEEPGVYHKKRFFKTNKK